VEPCSLAGAELIADQVQAYWAARGHKVNCSVYQVSRQTRRGPAIYGVKSDMVGGLPATWKAGA